MIPQSHSIEVDPITQLEDWLRMHGGYERVRRLPDGSLAAIGDLVFTTAVYLGVNRHGYERRFCFKHQDEARTAYFALQSEDDDPTGFLARRPIPAGTRDYE